MENVLKKSAQRVQDELNKYDFPLEVVTFPESTRTSIEAAKAIGCSLSQIAKSLIFKGMDSHEAILIIASGSNRVNEKAVNEVIGEKLGKANAEFVLNETGYAIGGIPPIGHIKPIKTFIDEDLLKLEVIWAAAGTPNTVFRLTPDILLTITKGEIISIK